MGGGGIGGVRGGGVVLGGMGGMVGGGVEGGVGGAPATDALDEFAGFDSGLAAPLPAPASSGFGGLGQLPADMFGGGEEEAPQEAAPSAPAAAGGGFGDFGAADAGDEDDFGGFGGVEQTAAAAAAAGDAFGDFGAGGGAAPPPAPARLCAGRASACPSRPLTSLPSLFF